jgi:hypothetical protein
MLVIPNEDGTYRDADDADPNPPATTDTDTDQESEFTPEPEPIPRPNLEAQLAEEREKRIRLEERLEAQKAARQELAAPEAPPTVFTRVELRTAVNEGKIDEDQMEEIWAKQNREQIQRDMQAQISARDRFRDTESFTETEMEKYITAYPGVKEVGSHEWKRVKTEYDFLRKMGDEDCKGTELKALRAAFGQNTDRIPERTASRRETVQDASGSQGGGRDDRPVDIWNRVPKWCKPYYKKQVEDGYKTLEDVRKDLPYMDQKH